MKHKGLIVVSLALPLFLAGCSASVGETPYLPDADSTSASNPSTSGGGSSSSGAAGTQNAPASPSNSGTSSDKDTGSGKGNPHEGGSGGKGSNGELQKDNPYGSHNPDEPVALGAEKDVSEEALKKAVETARKEAEKAGTTKDPSLFQPTETQTTGVTSIFNGAMGKIAAGEYADACEQYLYISEDESVDDCVAELRDVYENTSIDFSEMTAGNTEVYVHDKEHITTRLAGKDRDNAQLSNYFLVDGQWRLML